MVKELNWKCQLNPNKDILNSRLDNDMGLSRAFIYISIGKYARN